MLRKIAAALALVAGSASAQVDFTGAYSDDMQNFLVITQKGNVAIVTSTNVLQAGAPAGQTNSTSFGVGVVSGNNLIIQGFVNTTMYCVSNVTYTLTDPNTIVVTTDSIQITQRGLSAGGQNCAPSTARTRTRLL